MLGAVKRFLPDEGLLDAAIRGGSSLAKKDIEGITTLLVDAEMKMFDGLRTPVDLPAERRRRPAARPRLRATPSGSSPTTCASRYGAEPGFITMNLPALLPVLDELGIENPIVCSNINKIGFRMCGGLEAYETALRERRFRAVAMSVFASGAIPARRGDRVGLRAAERRVDRVRRVEPAEHPEHPRAGVRVLGLSATDDPARSVDRRAPQAAAPPAPAARRASTARTAGPRSTRRRVDRCSTARRSTSCTSSADATRSTCCATCPLPAASSAITTIDTIVSTGSAMALPFFALARARRLDCHYIESAARSDGPSATGRAISRIPGVRLYAQYSNWAGGGWHYRGSVFDSFEPDEDGAHPPIRLRKVVGHAGHLPRVRVRAAGTASAGRSCRPRPTCCGRRATPIPAASGSTASARYPSAT